VLLEVCRRGERMLRVREIIQSGYVISFCLQTGGNDVVQALLKLLQDGLQLRGR
jgi:hypothetical protein